ncbi:hypothetical protein JHK84_047634 [Glycine max]|uniref:uncharacterized protein n=1 Tax=Glycine max TaxID=3847 RepID=UPI000E21B380|nr:uncharacterized protein LOC100816400 [Glycine max]KAG4930649.1 hypothetical protein JHK86_047610 [Glycine max]KAG5102665.1 hypothetical protein JHK84_047634 [Glycine max]|eukprot:XP_025982357.1 uncharacterized protein LOC100816400 [Glycine max]
MGRESIANLQEVVESLCNVSRSSDERQRMVIESLVQLLIDPVTRYKVMDKVAPVLADLVELRDIKGKHKVIGKAIMKVLLHYFHRIKICKVSLYSERTRRLEELWNLKVERVKKEKLLSVQELREKEALSCVLKKEGRKSFFAGEIENAVVKYSEALNLCPLKLRKERIVLHSNRAQSYLLLRDSECAISDATRALCLSGAARPHGKSLWRRSQAFDMKGLTKESLMDCLAFIDTEGFKIPCYAAGFFN